MDDTEHTRYFPDTWENHGYKIVKNLAEGAYGEVYEVESQFAKHLAMKKVRLEFALQELDVMSRFRHPHIMEAYEVYRDSKHVYIVMPLAENSAVELLKSFNRGIDIEVKIRLLYEIISGLDFMLKRGVLHCDIKPDNIMMFNTTDNYINAYAKIGDMGLVKYHDYDITVCQTHASPEEIVRRKRAILYETLQAARSMDSNKVITELPYDQTKVSMYALGITMIEILSGMCLDSNTRGVYTYVYYFMNHPKVILQDMGINEEWIPLIERLINKNIDLRPSSFEEVLNYDGFKKRSFGKPINGVVLTNNPSQYCDVYMSEAVKTGIEDMSRLKADISIAALFIEILYRVFPKIIGFSEKDQNENNIYISLLVSSIIYLSAELVDQNLKQEISPDNLFKMMDMIYIIYIQLDGIIYIDTLYTKAHSAQMVKKLLTIALTDCNQYLSKSLTEHVHLLEREESAYQRGFRTNKDVDRSIEAYLKK